MTKREKPMPAASLYLLLALLGGENHGYALMQLVEQQSDGAVRMGPGTLYGTLNRLLAGGLITETTQVRSAGQVAADSAGLSAGQAPQTSSEERRRYYRLTADGSRVALNELSRLRTLVARFHGIGVTTAAGGIPR
jgi:DNA-binding PadR family transcriptional regulator